VRTTNPVEERALALIEPIAEGLGYRIVRIRISGLRRKTLQIMGERAADGVMLSGDCTRLARAIGEALEEIEYENLEVSSPGIDRPLMRLEDFARFAGHEAKLETTQMLDGRRRYKGMLKGVDGETIRIALEDGEFKVPFSALHDARLVLTDKLIEEDLRRAKAAEAEDAKEANQEVH
jgi:ribosome maturation factor RimP